MSARQMSLLTAGIPQRCEEWLRTPQGREAWAFIEARALELAGRGHTFGPQLLLENARYELYLSRTSGDGLEPYALNNSWASYLSRKLIEKHPHLEAHIRRRRVSWDEGGEPL